MNKCNRAIKVFGNDGFLFMWIGQFVDSILIEYIYFHYHLPFKNRFDVDSAHFPFKLKHMIYFLKQTSEEEMKNSIKRRSKIWPTINYKLQNALQFSMSPRSHISISTIHIRIQFSTIIQSQSNIGVRDGKSNDWTRFFLWFS